MDQERIFNLQLMVQRLEEELSLYRNGTTAEQLFDLMKEKESEIGDLKDSIADKESKLRKLAKSSTEFITKFEDLQISNRNTLLQLAEAHKDREGDLQDHIVVINEMNQKYDALQETLRLEKESSAALASTIREQEDQNRELMRQLSAKELVRTKLAEQLQEADRSIERLQKRCAELVGEKTQKFRLLDDERQDMITHVQDFRKSMTTNLAERDEVVQKKNEKIKELKMQLAISKQDAQAKAQKAAELQVDRDAFWEQKVLVANLQAKLEDSQRRMDQLEGQRRAWQEGRSEHEATKARLQHLEEKLMRHELQAKKRVLQDSTTAANAAAYNAANNAANSSGATKAVGNTSKVAPGTMGENVFEKASAKQAFKALAAGGKASNNSSNQLPSRATAIGDML